MTTVTTLLIDRWRGAWLGALLTAGLKPVSPPWLETATRHAHTLITEGKPSSTPLQEMLTLPITAMTAAHLPVILFFHEQPRQLTTHLEMLTQAWPRESADLMETLGRAIAYLISPNPQIREFLDHLGPLGIRITELLESGCSLAQAQRIIHNQLSPDQIPVAIALYCYCTTPQSMELCYKRVQQMPDSQEIAILSSILVGASHGTTPPFWYPKITQLTQSSIIDQLFAAWAGIQNPLPVKLPLLSAI
jgi:hypothetical protein